MHPRQVERLLLIVFSKSTGQQQIQRLEWNRNSMIYLRLGDLNTATVIRIFKHLQAGNGKST